MHAGHVDDYAAACLAVTGNARAAGNAYNITGPKAVTWRAYVERLAAIVGRFCPGLAHTPYHIARYVGGA